MKSYFAYVKFDSLLEIQVELLNKYLDMEVNMKIHIIESSAHRWCLKLLQVWLHKATIWKK